MKHEIRTYSSRCDLSLRNGVKRTNRYAARVSQKKIVPDTKKPLELHASLVTRMAGANFVYEDK